MVFVYTRAYNAEKTICRSIDSIVNQTYKDWVYYICDNGSTDSTWDLLQDYAARDNRIRLYRNEKNTTNTGFDGWTGSKILDSLIENMDGKHYYCRLDADDEYELVFLDKTLSFMQKHDLDFAACGSEIIDGQENKLIDKRELEQDLIIEGDGFSDDFPLYVEFMRPSWGKIYKLSLLKKRDDINTRKLKYGSDTLFVIGVMRHANRMGVLSGTAHKYYLISSSVSNKWNTDRIKAPKKLDDEFRNFLLLKSGKVNKQNDGVLCHAYLVHVKNALDVMRGARPAFREKLYVWFYLIFNRKTIRGFVKIKWQLVCNRIRRLSE